MTHFAMNSIGCDYQNGPAEILQQHLDEVQVEMPETQQSPLLLREQLMNQSTNLLVTVVVIKLNSPR